LSNQGKLRRVSDEFDRGSRSLGRPFGALKKIDSLLGLHNSLPSLGEINELCKGPSGGPYGVPQAWFQSGYDTRSKAEVLLGRSRLD
jgi:hypothetical protein